MSTYQSPTGYGYPQPQRPPAAKPPREPVKMNTASKIGLSIAAIFVVLMAGIGIGQAGNTPASDAVANSPRATVTVTAPADQSLPKASKPVEEAPAVGTEMPDPGTYLVGKDIKPGTYASAGGDSCYWARLKTLDGSLDSIITNDMASGRAIVTIRKTDVAFKFERCAPFLPVG